EPTIFEQPIHSKDKDPEVGEDAIYMPEYGANGRGPSRVGEEGEEEEDFRDYVFPEERKLGTWSTAFLIFNRVVGAGIFSTPSSIIHYTNSVGATLLFWVLGGVMTFCGLAVYLEFGTAIPRSGGEKVYLERVYRKPKYLATCIFAVQFILFAISTVGSVSFSSYLLRCVLGSPDTTTTGGTAQEDATKYEGTWLNRGIAVAAITAVCLIHAFLPRLGIWLSNGLGVFKLVLLILVVCTGFAALAGNMEGESPRNFSSFDGPGDATGNGDDQTDGMGNNVAGSAAGYALALLQVLYSYGGWENANYVLSEVRDAPKTLRLAAPIAIGTVTVLYVLANIAYFAAMTKDELSKSGVVPTAIFFTRVWGPSAFTERVMPLFLALSALGNVFAQSFAMPRVKQELAKEGTLPFSRFWASDWPEQKSPTGAILLHWIFTVALILGSSTKDVYQFLSNIFTYSGNWIKVFLGVGLLYLNFTPSENWTTPENKRFHSYPVLTVFWVVGLLYTCAAPFIPNTLLTKVHFSVVPALGTGMLVIGVMYWVVWAKVLPAFGFSIQHEVVVLPDGSERVKYKRVRPRGGRSGARGRRNGGRGGGRGGGGGGGTTVVWR
ncbi:hypothetical protein GE21DRAFT_4025, partial [Neurospora crassa]